MDDDEPNSVWTFHVSRHVGKENIGYVNDLSRMIALQVVIQMMLHVTDPERYSFADGDFVVLVLFIIVSVSAYWLVFRRLIRFD